MGINMDHVLCSQCGHNLKFREEHLGRNVKCPKCGNIFRLPSPVLQDGPIEPEHRPAIPVVVNTKRGSGEPQRGCKAGGCPAQRPWHFLVKKGEYDKAIEEYSEAIRIDPTLANAYFNRGFVWYKKRDYDKAIEGSPGDSLNANDADYHNVRGLAWDDKGDHDKAIADYSEAIRLNPNLAVAYNNRGLAWAQKGCREKAAADYTEALARSRPRCRPAKSSGTSQWGREPSGCSAQQRWSFLVGQGRV